MVLLKTPKRYLTIFGILPVPEHHLPNLLNLRKNQSLFNSMHIGFIIVCLALYISSVLYFLFYRAKTFAEYSETALFLVVSVTRIAFYFMLLSQKKELASLFMDLGETIETRSENQKIRDIYLDENAKLDKFIKTIWNGLSAVLGLSAALKVIESYCKYYVYHLSDESFKFLTPTAFPWNVKTPFGYLISISIQFFWLYCGAFMAITTLLTFGGLCMLFAAFPLDIQAEFNDLNTDLLSVHRNFTPENRCEFYKRLSNIAEIHKIAQQFVKRFSNTYGILVTAFFALSTIAICTALLSLNEAVSQHNHVDVIRLIIFLSAALLYIAYLCLFGEKVTSQFDNINDSIGQCSWYEFPMEMQRILPMMLLMAQNPVLVEAAYLNIGCSREVLKKIINSAYSYFSMMRGFSK